MAYIIKKTTVDGVEFVGCYLTGTDMETVSVGVAEATVTAAASNTETTVTAPTSAQSVGVGRSGIDYIPQGRWERGGVSGFVFHIREMVRQRGHWDHREDYDQRIPIRGRTGQVPSRRWSQFGTY